MDFISWQEIQKSSVLVASIAVLNAPQKKIPEIKTRAVKISGRFLLSARQREEAFCKFIPVLNIV